MVNAPRPEAPSRRRSAAIRPGQMLAGALIVLAVVFIVQNRERVRINLFTVDVFAPVWLVLTVTVLVGVVIGRLLRRKR